MKIVWPIVLVLVLVAVLAPELARYQAEHKLYAATGAFYALRANPKQAANPGRALDWVTTQAIDAASALDGDPRPWLVAAGAQMLARKPGAAVDLYRHVLRLGERPEIELNLGQAYLLLGDQQRAATALMRGGWVAPILLDTLVPTTRDAIRIAIRDRQAAFERGEITAPPPSSLDSGR